MCYNWYKSRVGENFGKEGRFYVLIRSRYVALVVTLHALRLITTSVIQVSEMGTEIQLMIEHTVVQDTSFHHP